MVLAVPEGDTLEVLHKGTVLLIRLQDVDAPEMSQPYGAQSQALMVSLALGKTARIITTDTSRPGILQKGQITLSSGLNLSHELLKAGLGWWDRVAAPDNDSLWKLEREARIERRGLWEDADPIPPWEWRKGF
ncbi:MAG: thermonuclease family protein [Nitrospirota bacterium]